MYLEFFSGDANAYRTITTSGYPGCAVDIRYMEGIGDLKSNPCDILSPSGFALRPYKIVLHTCLMSSENTNKKTLGFWGC